MRKTKYRIARFASLLCVVAMAVSAIAFAPKAAWAADSTPAVTYTVKIDGRVYSTDYVSGRRIDIAKDTKIAEIMKAHSVSVNKVERISAPSNIKLVKLFYGGNEFALSGAGRSTVNIQCSALGSQPLAFADITVEAKQNPRTTASAGSGAYFKAQADEVTVTFDPNGGTGTATTQKVEKGTATPLTANAFTNDGQTFDGWNTAADGSGDAYADKADITTDSDVTLYAQWKPAEGDEYDVTLDYNDSSSETISFKIKKNESHNVEIKTRNGYVLVGWNTELDGSGEAYNGDLKDLSARISKSLTLYAQWKAVDYTVKFDANKGEGTMTDEPFAYDEEKALTKNTFTYKGHTFKGWNTDADGKGTSYTDEQKVKNLTDTEGGVVTLFAQWDPIDVHITFDGNGADSGSMDKQTSKYNEEITLNENKYSRTGYIFSGWNTKADGTGTKVNGTTPDKPSKVRVKSDTTLYAQWIEDKPVVEKVIVTFDANGGSGSMAQQIEIKGSTGKLAANTFTREGYTFDGWKDKDGKTYKDQQVVTFSYDGTLYAQWKLNTVKLTFVANGGTGKMDAIDVEPNKEITLPACTMTRSGYTFKGWNTAANGTGTSVADKATVKLTKDTRLYAQWQKNTATANTSSNSTDAYKQGNLAKTNDPTPVNTIVIVAVIGAALAGAGYYFNKKRG